MGSRKWGKELRSHTVFLFNLGGSGILISQSAMRKMYKIIDKCIIKYKSCWAGDVRTALCLRDAGIKLNTKVKGFQSDPPNLYQGWWPSNPCSTPFSYHHLNNYQVQLLDNVKGPSDSIITYADVLATLQDDDDSDLNENLDIVRNTVRKGSDFKSIKFVGTFDDELAAQECRNLCKTDSRCRAWTFDEKSCWLKNGISKQGKKNGSWSGISLLRYTCDL